MRRRCAFQGPLAVALLVVGLVGCGSEPPVSPRGRGLSAPVATDPPSGAGAMAPGAATGQGGAHLVWIEPLPESGHRLLTSLLLPTTDAAAAGRWREPVEVARGDQFFANWADTPGVVEAADGTLYTHWLEKLGAGTYAYGVQVARSRDGGLTWQRLGWLHDDVSETEHGFAAWVPSRSLESGAEAGAVAESTVAEPAAVEAVWLDGRGTATGGPMQLRAARLDGTKVAGTEVASSEVVASSVCDCCPTAMAVAARGPVVAYRGRSPEEVRDIHLARRTEEGWQTPTRVGADDWTIAGCPVNGPAVAAVGDRVAVAWFTAAGGEARVQVAISSDGGASFDPPVLLDDAGPVGRVGIAAAGEQLFVTWIGRRAAADGNRDGAEIRLARLGPSVGGTSIVTVDTVATTAAARSAGVPRLVHVADRLLVIWVEPSEPSVLRATAIRI